MTKFNYTLDMAPDTVRYRVADAAQAARLEGLGVGVEFDALSIGSPNGSAAIIPLDESSREIGQRLLQCWNAMLLVDHPDVMVPGGVHIHLARFQQYHKLLNDLKPAIRSLVALMDAIPDSEWPADVDRQELGADMGDCLTLLDAILRPGVPEVVPATKNQQQAGAGSVYGGNLAALVSEAMGRYLRVCGSGGMGQEDRQMVQAHVDEAERLGYFQLAIAGAILEDRAAQQAKQP